MPSCFNDLVRPDIVLAINTGSSELVVKETGDEAILKRLSITNLPQNSFAFELDHNPCAALRKKYNLAFDQLSCLIQSDHTLANKKCDLVLIVQEDGIYQVIIADLKSKSPNKSLCKKQLRNSELYFEYLLSLVKEYHNSRITMDRVHKIIFHVAGRTVKPVAQQKNAKKYELKDGVKFFPIVVSGHNNSQGRVSYRALVS